MTVCLPMHACISKLSRGLPGGHSARMTTPKGPPSPSGARLSEREEEGAPALNTLCGLARSLAGRPCATDRSRCLDSGVSESNSSRARRVGWLEKLPAPSPRPEARARTPEPAATETPQQPPFDRLRATPTASLRADGQDGTGPRRTGKPEAAAADSPSRQTG